MHPAVVIGTCLAVLLLLGVCERLARDRSRRAVPIRIHINGTRGKSTVTRLIWGALLEAGIPAAAKTTGTAARLLLPDGTERRVPRHAPASIREQLWLLRQARRAGARAVVAECMAVEPELQWISERQMLSATIGVITNVRSDHTDVMGRTLEQGAASLANTTPTAGVLVVGDRRHLPLFERRAARMGTRVVSLAADEPEDGALRTWELENRALALAVTRELGIPDKVALDGMRRAAHDPGAFKTGTMAIGGRSVAFIDATAANDPESLALLLTGTASSQRPPTNALPADSEDPANQMVVYNHREDRAERLRVFATDCQYLQHARYLVVTGDRPSVALLRLARARRGGRPVLFAARRHLREVLARLVQTAPEVTRIVFCGNTRRLDVSSVFREELASLARSSVSDS